MQQPEVVRYSCSSCMTRGTRTLRRTESFLPISGAHSTASSASWPQGLAMWTSVLFSGMHRAEPDWCLPSSWAVTPMAYHLTALKLVKQLSNTTFLTPGTYRSWSWSRLISSGTHGRASKRQGRR